MNINHSKAEDGLNIIKSLVSINNLEISDMGYEWDDMIRLEMGVAKGDTQKAHNRLLANPAEPKNGQVAFCVARAVRRNSSPRL